MTDQQGWVPPQQPQREQGQQPNGIPQQYPTQPPQPDNDVWATSPSGYRQPPPGYQQPAPGYGYPPPQQGYAMPGPGPGSRGPRKRHRVRNVILGTVGAIVLIIVIASVANSGKHNTASNSPGSVATSQAPASPAATTPSPAVPAAPQYTPEQQQAIEAAKQYLQMGTGFSRKGLIQQLDSSAGNSFPRSVAKFAVNHIKVNWDQQAVEAAKGYMQEGGFSYTGMVQQLDSAYGSDFTYSQAVYGAKAVGL
jgi:Host cell surface-exposed lipoprotein